MIIDTNQEKKKDTALDLNKYQEYTIDTLIKNRVAELQ